MSGTINYGTGSLNNNTGANNSAFGWYAAYNNTDASCNTAIGANALFYNTNAPYNTAIGAGSMCRNTTGQSNTAVGLSALRGPSAPGSVGDYNVAIGGYALYNNIDASCNTAIGTYSGYDNIDGNYNTFLGMNSNVYSSANTYDNSTALGYGAIIDASNQIVLGGQPSGGSYPGVKIPGSYLGIGGNYDSGGNYALDVSGNINFTGSLFQKGIAFSGTTPWNTTISGNNIYYNAGTVGIGTDAPNTNYKLDVSGNAHVSNDLDVSGNAVIDGTLDVINTLTVNNGEVDISGNAHVSNDLDVSGNAVIDGEVDISGNAHVSNDLDVSGNVVIDGSLNVINTLTVNNGEVNISGNAHVSNDLDVSGNVVIDGTLDVSGNAVIDGTLDVSGNDATINTLTVGLGGGNIPSNTAVGYQALLNNETGSNNTAYGYQSLYNNTIGSNNTACGEFAGYDLSGNSSYNTFLGMNSNVDSDESIYNNSTALGYGAIIDASNQIVLGGQPSGGSYPGVKIPGSYLGIGGNYDSGGNYALDVSGNINFTGSLYANGIAFSGTQWTTTISGNNIYYNAGTVGIGTNDPNTNYKLDVSGNAVIDGTLDVSGNVDISGNLDVSGNVVIDGTLDVSGNVDISGNLDVSGNVVIDGTLDVSGNDATINTLTVGLGGGNIPSNTAVGYQALLNNETGSNNTANGYQSLFKNTIGSNNTALGYRAGYDLSGNSSYNTFLGYGADIDSSGNTYNYSTALGYGAIIDASNQIVLGRATETVYIPGTLDVSGNITADYMYLSSGTYTTAGNGVVPKSYVDSLGAGLRPYGKVKAISSYDSSGNNTVYPVPIDPSNVIYPFVIDDVSIYTGDNVLLNDQGNNNGQDAAQNNGVYTLTEQGGNYQFQRSTAIMPLGVSSKSAYISVVEGTVNALSGWIQTNNNAPPDTVGTTPLIFSNYFSFAFRLGEGLYPTQQDEQIYINVDSSLNFINYIDGSNNLTINVGTNTSTVNIGKTNTNIYGNVDISGNLDVSGNVVIDGSLNVIGNDATINTLTVGLGGGNIPSNTAVGYQALLRNETGVENTAVGYEALYNDLSGNNNTAVGYQALYTDASGNNNTAVGYKALYTNQSGINNTAIGTYSQVESTGSENTSVGHQSLFKNTTGNYNTAFGTFNLYDNISGNYNTSVGFQSLFYNNNNKNTAVGFAAGMNNINGGNNTFLGFQADVDSSANTYDNSTAIGAGAIIDASNQIVLGGQPSGGSYPGVKIPGSYLGIGGNYDSSGNYALDVSGNINFTGSLFENGSTFSGSTQWITYANGIYYNVGTVGIGTTTPSSNYKLDVSGNAHVSNDLDVSGNVVINGTLDVSGNDATINTLTVGLGGGNQLNNTALGRNALINNNDISGNYNTAVGDHALYNNSNGYNNTAVGYQALLSNETGYANTAVGYEALYTDISSNANTAVGLKSLYYTTGAQNTANGYQSLYYNTTGSGNTAFGTWGLFNNLTGSENTALGYKAGYDLSGNSPSSYNTFLGTNSNVYNSGNIYDYSTALGYGAIIDASNQIVLGRATERVYIPGTVGIGTPTPNNIYKLDVSGNINAITFNAQSDYRIKENVTQLDSTFVVDNLNPVTYLNTRLGKQDIGLIAHEVQEIYPELVNGEKDGEHFQSVNYIGFIPILIKEIQILKKSEESLEARIKLLEERN
jgi:cytoskeletal protein CcmA (bactofilin family)